MPYTRMFASLSLFVCVVTVAHGQAGPMTKKAPTAPTVIEGSDLVVSSIKFDHDFGRTAQWAVAVSPYLRILVLVKNQGNVLWASRGRVEASLENANLDRTTVVAAPPRRDGPSSGVSVAPPSSRGGNRVSGAGAFREASAPIPGSIRPGDSAFVFMYARTRMGGDSVSMDVGKYVTYTARIIATDETHTRNNTSMRVGRLERSNEHFDMVWEPLKIRGGEGAVAVNAPTPR